MMQSVVLTLLFALLAMNCVLTIREIDRPRKPITRDVAVGICTMNVLIAWAIWWLAR